MSYGVIVCPHCRKVKGVDLSKKTTKCIRCGKTLTLIQLVVQYRTDSASELRQAIGIINAKLDGELDTFQKSIETK